MSLFGRKPQYLVFLLDRDYTRFYPQKNAREQSEGSDLMWGGWLRWRSISEKGGRKDGDGQGGQGGRFGTTDPDHRKKPQRVDDSQGLFRFLHLSLRGNRVGVADCRDH